MSFDLKIDFDPGAAISGPAQVETALNKATDAAKDTGEALMKAGKAGADAGAAVADGMNRGSTAARKAQEAVAGMAAGLERQKAFSEAYRKAMDEQWAAINQQKFDDENLKRMQAPMVAFQEGVASLNRLFDSAKISADQYDAELAKLTADMEKSSPVKLSDELKQQEAMLAKIQAPLQNYQAGVTALNALFNQGKISTDQYDAELAKLEGQLGKTRTTGLSTELQREAEILERLRKPMRDYEADVAALNALLAKGQVSQTEYNRELERAAGKAGTGLGPTQGPKEPGATAADPGHGGTAGQVNPLADALGAVAPQLGATGQLLSGLASNGVIAAGAVVGLGVELVRLGDTYTTLENKINKFTFAGDSANQILHQQLDLSNEIHADLSTTVELYSHVREGTDELNLSRRRQIELTREIGDAVVASGKSAESAEALTRQLSFAFASGAFRGRELLMIMRQFPDIANAFTASTGKSRLELLQLANKGEFTASMILQSFDKIGPEMAKRVEHMRETTGQTWQHFKDWLAVQAGSTTDLVTSQMLAQIDAADQGMTVAQANLQKRLQEMQRQIKVEQERTAHVAEIDTAARSRGISIGPFDKAAADSLDRARITARAAGIEMQDAFAGAKDKARLYGAEIDKLKDSDATKKIADAAKRIYDAMAGADELIYKAQQHWTDLSDRIATAQKAVEKYQAASSHITRDQVELQRQIALDTIQQQYEETYGKVITGMVQGKEKARQELRDLTEAMHDGVVVGEQARTTYDHLMTTINDGRLPAAIKAWESLSLPLRDASDAMFGMTAIFEAGRISVTRYVEEMQKLTPALTKLQEAERLQAQMPQYLRDRALSLRGLGEQRGVIAVIDVTEEAKAAIEQQYKLLDEANRAAEDARAIAAGNGKNLPYLKSVLSFQDALGGAGANPLSPQENDAPGRALQEQLERARQLSNEFEAPAVKYEQALKDIAAAVDSWGLAEERASVLRRRAQITFNDEMEALQKARGPLEQYEATLRKLNDQYQHGELSARKHADGVNAAKVTMIEATGEARDFSGAMQIEWIKMQQDADALGASLAKVAVSGVDKLNDAIIGLASGAEVSFSKMAESILEDLERILLKAAEVEAIKGLMELFSSGGGGGGSAASSGGGGGGGSAASSSDSGPDVGAIGISALQLAGTLSGYATGGSWTVGGSGSSDNQLQAFMATPGERVTVTPRGAAAPGAYPFAAGPGGYAMPVAAAQQAPVVNVHNHYDSSIGVASIASPAGQTQILNVLRANAPAVRSALGVK